MGEQIFDRTKKILFFSLLVLFVLLFTATSATAEKISSTAAGTTSDMIAGRLWSMTDYDRDGIPDLLLIRTDNTRSGKVEVYIASGVSNFKDRIAATPSMFGPETDGVWTMADLDRDGIPDLVYIKTSNVASGKVEVHAASGASNYKDRIAAAPSMFGPETDGVWTMADLDRDGIPDLVYIKTSNVASGKVEVHAASGASNYKDRIAAAPSMFGPETDGVWTMADLDRDGISDLVYIKTSNVASGKVEVHAASGASNYKDRIAAAPSMFGPETDGVWTMADLDRDRISDLVYIKTEHTGTRKVEVHAASGASNYKDRIAAAPSIFNQTVVIIN